MYPKSIQKIINLFTLFPTVGPRTAARFAFYLINRRKEEVDELIEAIQTLKKKVKICSSCFNTFEGDGDLCKICEDATRDKSLLSIVEKETDLSVIENTKKYRGLYFVLGGTVSSLRKKDIQKLRVEELKKVIKRGGEIKEIIIATNPTTEGEATALYLERILKPFNKKITRLGRGLPVGSEIEYADPQTLRDSLEGRK